MLLFLTVCSCPEVGHSQGEEEGSTWFLKSPKAPPSPAQNSEPLDPMNSCNITSGLVDAKAKDILLTVREDQLLK